MQDRCAVANTEAVATQTRCPSPEYHTLLIRLSAKHHDPAFVVQSWRRYLILQLLSHFFRSLKLLDRGMSLYGSHSLLKRTVLLRSKQCFRMNKSVELRSAQAEMSGPGELPSLQWYYDLLFRALLPTCLSSRFSYGR